MERFNLTHARHDPAHCLAPGLFRAIQHGSRQGRNLKIYYEFSAWESIEFSCFEPLGADDLRVLQGLVALAAVSCDDGPSELPTDPKTALGQILRDSLWLEGNAKHSLLLVARGTYRRLAKEIGMDPDSGSSFRAIRSSIERLWKVSVIVRQGGKSSGFRLLSHYHSDEAENSLCVCLNPRIADAILGERRHVRIPMAEVRTIKRDATRLIHQRLCAFINQGKARNITAATLCAYIWPDCPGEVVKDGTRRQRVSRMRKALAELQNLGWGVHEYAKGKFAIARPREGGPAER